MQHETRDMGREVGYRRLNVYQFSHKLVIEIYKVTKYYPKVELFGLVSQMRRCAISIVANIVEGYGRRTIKEKINFYYIARGSLTELEYYLDLSLELSLVNKEIYNNIIKIRCDAGRLLNGLIKSLER